MHQLNACTMSCNMRVIVSGLISTLLTIRNEPSTARDGRGTHAAVGCVFSNCPITSTLGRLLGRGTSRRIRRVHRHRKPPRARRPQTSARPEPRRSGSVTCEKAGGLHSAAETLLVCESTAQGQHDQITFNVHHVITTMQR